MEENRTKIEEAQRKLVRFKMGCRKAVLVYVGICCRINRSFLELIYAFFLH